MASGAVSSISFLLPNLGIGGAEKATVKLANELFARGYVVRIIVATNRSFALEHALVDGVELIKLRSKALKNSLPRLLFHLTSTRPNFCVAITRDCCALSAVLRHITPSTIKWIFSERSSIGSWLKQEKSGIKRWMKRQMFRLVFLSADQIHCVSNYSKSDMVKNLGIDDAKIYVVYNIVTVDALIPTSCTELDALKSPFCLSVGRLVDEKNFEFLISAFALGSPSNFDLIIIGEGYSRRKLSTLIASLNLTDRIHLVGSKSNVAPWLINMSAYLSSSLREGFPNALAEASGLGKPIIALEGSGGIREILTNNDNAFIIRDNNIEEYAKTISSVLKNLGTNPVESLATSDERFSAKVVGDDFQRVFLE